MESARAYGIYARVVDVSEIERASAVNEWDFWYKDNECVNTVQSTLNVVLCLLDTYWDLKSCLSSLMTNQEKTLLHDFKSKTHAKITTLA